MMFVGARFLRFLTLVLFLSTSVEAKLPAWSYDPGPNPETKLGKELIDLVAEIPDMPEISEAVTGEQKFRAAFGPTNWRMRQQPGATKILFIGQDATHQAEAAARTATAGFGGRAQDLARHFGVNESAAFINCYAFTIFGQYGARNTPIFFDLGTLKPKVEFDQFVDNQLWLMTHDPESPITQWRNRYIDWIIRNNRDDLKLIVLFGKAAHDAAGVFVQSKGGTVGTKYDTKQLANMQIAETNNVRGGGNNEFPVLLGKKDQDLYGEKLGRKLRYAHREQGPKDQKAALDSVKADAQWYAERAVFTKGGPLKNGLIHPAQVGGFELDQMKINNVKTISLRGITLDDGTTLENDVLIMELPHPTFLTNVEREEKGTASRLVARALKFLDDNKPKGWEIKPDPGMVSDYSKGDPYTYAHSDIGPEYYDFGAPKTRMVGETRATRPDGHPYSIVFGSEKRMTVDMAVIEKLTENRPAGALPSDKEMYTTRPRLPENRYTFDPGPGEAYAKLMKENLALEQIFEPKPNKKWDEDGIQMYNVKNHPDVGDFGHYRGTFEKPRVIILADPDTDDDIITARALTGPRGQYLHGLMQDLDVDENYLVIKTVPFRMTNAIPAEWRRVLALTDKYRERLFAELLKDPQYTPDLVIADGEQASVLIDRLVKSKGLTPVKISRSEKTEEDLADAAEEITKLSKFKGKKYAGKIADLPRKHLSYYARLWEGTSGNLVADPTDYQVGQVFVEVAPRWAWEQDRPLEGSAKKQVEILIQKLRDNKVRLPGESNEAFLKRMNRRAEAFYLLAS